MRKSAEPMWPDVYYETLCDVIVEVTGYPLQI